MATIEEVKDYIGKETGVSDWFLIDQERINKFAAVTEDYQFIHTKPEEAAKTPFGTTIAHGFLTLSLLSHFVEGQTVPIDNVVMGINYGFDKVRFLAPVKVNSNIRAHIVLTEITEKPGNRVLLKNTITVEIEGEKTPALIAEWLTLIVIG